MNCPRCNGCMGCMMQNDFFDTGHTTGRCQPVAWRCLICDEVPDPVILKHRSSPSHPMVDRARLPRAVHNFLKVR